MKKAFLILLTILLLLTLTGCTKLKSDDSSRVTLYMSSGEKVVLKKVCIDGFVYIYGGCMLTPKIKHQSPSGVVIERCKE